MRQTLVSGDVRAKEVAALVSEVKRRQLRLESLLSAPCQDGCTECVPCRKGVKGYYQTDCETLRNDIIAGNRWRWKKRVEYEQLVNEFERASREFSRRYKLSPLVDLVDVAFRAIRAAAVKRDPAKWRDAAESAFIYLHKLFNYNDEMAKEFHRELGDKQAKVTNAWARAKDADETFERQVRKFKEERCTLVLMPEYFNRP